MKTNKIICGDNLKIIKAFPANCVDLTITSPPYDNMRDYKKGYKFNFEELAQELYRITKKGGLVVWIVGDETKKGDESGTSFTQALFFKSIGFKLHDTMIYEKSCFSNPSNNRYHQIFEYMFVFVKGKLKTFNPIKDRKNKSYEMGWSFGNQTRQKDGTIKKHDRESIVCDKYGMRRNIWRYPTGKGLSSKDEIAFEHPAIFPEALVKDHIISWSNPGDLVLDPMNGSGTTTKMAILTGRKYLGIDCSEEYCKIAEERKIIAELEVKNRPKKLLLWGN